MINLFKNKHIDKSGNDEFLSKVASLLIHAAKIDEIYTDDEKEIIKNNYKLTNLIHPTNEIPKCFKIGHGNIIFGYVHISFDVEIKNFSIVSNYCDLGHNLMVNNYFTAMPGVIVGGNCEIRENTLIGSGVKIHQNLKIGKNCKIGMGTLVTSNIKSNTATVDHPRKIVKEI